MKPGYKTTEFYITLAAGIVTAVQAVPTPHNAQGYILLGLAGVYSLARGLAKAGIRPAQQALDVEKTAEDVNAQAQAVALGTENNRSDQPSSP
jgi:hypothetical protein